MANSELTKATADAFSQLTLGITNFLGKPPADTPPAVKDDLKTLLTTIDSIANTLAAKTIENAIADLKKPAVKIEQVTERLNDAIKAIKSRDQAFKALGKLIGSLKSLAGGLKSGDLSSIGTIAKKLNLKKNDEDNNKD